MRIGIRWQTAVLFIPIMTGLAAVGSALILWGHRAELRWGLEEQARSIAVATAEFLAAEDLATAPLPPAIGAAMARVAADNGVASLVLTDAAGRILFRVGDGLPAIAPDLPARTVVDPVRSVNGQTRIAARAPVGEGHQLTLDLRADGYVEELARVRRLCLLLIGAGFLAGLLPGLAVSGRIAVRLGALNRRMGTLSERRFRPDDTVTGIQEVEDLDNALCTMDSVLRARRAASERLSIENEQFRTVRDLADTLGHNVMPDIDAIAGGRHVLAKRIGGETGQILKLVDGGDRGHLLLGTLQEKDPLRQAMAAGALAELIAARLVTDGTDAVMADMADWGLADRLLVIGWTADGGHATMWELKGGALTRTEVPGDSPIAAGVMTGSGERLLRRYMERFPGIGPGERATDLSSILQRRCVGTYALISRAKA